MRVWTEEGRWVAREVEAGSAKLRRASGALSGGSFLFSQVVVLYLVRGPFGSGA